MNEMDLSCRLLYMTLFSLSVILQTFFIFFCLLVILYFYLFLDLIVFFSNSLSVYLYSAFPFLWEACPCYNDT